MSVIEKINSVTSPTAVDGLAYSAIAKVNSVEIPSSWPTVTSPVNHWKLQETSGTTAYDSGTNPVDGTIGGTVTVNSTGKIDKSYYFHKGYIDMPSYSLASGTTGIAVCFWMYRKSNSYDRPFTFSNSTGIVFMGQPLYSNGNSYWVCGQDGGSDVIGKTSPSYYNAWHHWVFWKDVTAGVMKIYIDGSEWHSGTGLTKPVDVTPTDGQLGLNHPNSSYYDFYGYLEDFRVYSYALSAQEILNLYNDGDGTLL